MALRFGYVDAIAVGALYAYSMVAEYADLTIQVVFPQARHQVMPLYKTQFVLTMQDTSVVSLLAVQDMTRAVTVITSRTMDPIISLVITSVVYLLLGFVANRMLSLADRNKHLECKEVA